MAQWQWNDNRDTAFFVTKQGLNYKVSFFPVADSVAPTGISTWSVTFVPQGSNSVKLTGTGSEQEIFKTVHEITLEFYENKPKYGLCLSADQDSDTRVSLYARCAKLLAKELKMEVKELTYDDRNQVIFWLAP